MEDDIMTWSACCCSTIYRSHAYKCYRIALPVQLTVFNSVSKMEENCCIVKKCYNETIYIYIQIYKCNEIKMVLCFYSR